MKNWKKKILYSTALLGAIAPLVATNSTVQARSLLKTDNKGTYYQLRSGNTLWWVSNRYGVAINTLRKNSGLTASQDSTLQVGQKIYISLKSKPNPGGSTKPTKPTTPAPTTPIGDSESAEDKLNKSEVEKWKELVVPPNIHDLRAQHNNKLSFRDNTQAIGAMPYITGSGFPIPIMLELLPDHPDYAYYIQRGMYVNIGRDKVVVLYLNFYKDNLYYYSPSIRYLDNGLKDYYSGKSKVIRREIYERIAGYDNGRYLPTHNRTEQDIRSNSTYRTSRPGTSGVGEHSKFGSLNYAGSILNSSGTNGMNWDYVAENIYGEKHATYGQHNFRRYTSKTMQQAPPTRANLTLASNSSVRHVDMYQRNRPHTRTAQSNPTEGKQVYRWGEYRYLGYLTTGEPFYNPAFPVDGLGRAGSDLLVNYPFREFPWARDGNYGLNYHSQTDEGAFQWAMRKGMFGLTPNGRNSHYYKEFYAGNKYTAAQWRDAEQEFLRKQGAMAKMYNSTPRLRAAMAHPVNGGYKGQQAIDALTVLYGSLESLPDEPDNVISVSFVRDEIAINTGGQQIRYSLTLTLESDPGIIDTMHDTKIIEQKVYRGNELLQTFTRNPNTGKTTVVNANRKYPNGVAPEIDAGDVLTVKTNARIYGEYFRDAMNGVIGVQAHMGTGNNRIITTPKRNVFLGNRGPIKANANNIFTHTYTVPDPDDDILYTIRGELDRELYIMNSDMFYNSKFHDAENTLKIIADKGNFSSVDTRVVEVLSGNRERVLGKNETPIPGHTYKLRYAFKYESVNGRDARRYTQLRVDHDIGRAMVGSPIHGRENTGTISTNTINIKPKHNQTYTLDSKPYVFETGQFDTVGRLVVGLDRYDLVRNDNNYKDEWSSRYDISVDNVRVVPRNTINTQDQLAEMLVQFDVGYDIPSGIKDLGQDVSFAVDLNGKVVYVKEHIRSGLNRNISVPIEINLEGNVDQILHANVIANNDLAVYEEGVYNGNMSNNRASGQGQVKNDKIVPFKNSNNRRTWTQYVHQNNWNGQSVNYRTFNNNRSRNFLRFTSPDNQHSTSRHDLFEQYRIDSVRFRSRLTRQRGLGEDGWVDLMKEDGYIKAGYGYELEIDVSYNTNALDQPFVNLSNPNGTGRWTRPILINPLLQDNIYVEMQDGHIRSALGDGGTEQALRLKDKNESKGRTTWTFEVDGGEVLGAETVGRFYIGENVKDGRYPLNVFTPKIQGVNGKQTSATQALEYLLFDSASDLGINVEGSATDDITDHINR